MYGRNLKLHSILDGFWYNKIITFFNLFLIFLIYFRKKYDSYSLGIRIIILSYNSESKILIIQKSSKILFTFNTIMTYFLYIIFRF